MMTKITQRIMQKFGCSNCRYLALSTGGRGSKTSCSHPRVKGKMAIRYIKRCPK